jgi:hypothetical protein
VSQEIKISATKIIQNDFEGSKEQIKELIDQLQHTDKKID